MKNLLLMELDTIISPPVGIRNNLVIILLVAEDSIEEFLASRSYWIPLILFNSPVNSSCIHSWGQKNLPHTYLKYEQSFCVPSGLFCHLIQLSLPEHVTTRQSAQVLRWSLGTRALHKISSCSLLYWNQSSLFLYWNQRSCNFHPGLQTV